MHLNHYLKGDKRGVLDVQAASALVPKSSLPAKGLSRVVIVACMFGNSFTLPLVFMMSLLPSTLAEFAPAYVAMFLVGWSPLFWGLGNYIVRGKDDHDAGAPKEDWIYL